MKFWQLTLIMLLFNVFGSALVNSGLFTSMGMTETFTISSPTQEDIEEIEEGTKGSISDEVSATTPVESAFAWVSSMIVKTVSNFFDPLERYIFWPAMIMQMFGMPNELGFAFTVVFNTIQVIGIIQFITGRNLRDYE